MASGTREKKPTKGSGKSVMEKLIECATHANNEYAKKEFKDRKATMEELVKLSEATGYRTEETKRFQTIQEETEEARQHLLAMSMMGFTKKLPLKTDDGNQTPVRSEDALRLKYMWASGMDWVPLGPNASRWMKCLAAGDYNKMISFINNASNIKELLEQRETFLNFSALFHIVKGTAGIERFVPGTNYVESQGGSTLPVYDANTQSNAGISSNQSNLPRHVECLCKIIELGGNIHARDFAGYTPLFYCVTQYSNPVTLKLASILLKHGADINAQNRFGETAIFDAVFSKTLVCVEFLLDRGLDPTIRDNDGCSVEGLNPYDRDLRILFGTARRNKSKAMKEVAKDEAGGSLKKCEVCGALNARRCTSCFLTRYCGRDCQRVHWPQHKIKCKEVRRQFLPVTLVQPFEGAEFQHISWNKNGKIKNIRSVVPAKSNFVVKIQIPFDDTSSKRWRERMGGALSGKVLVLYDEKKSVYGYINSDEPTYDILVSKIKAEGVFGDKGFFYAFYDKHDTLKINVSNILPPRTW